MKNLTKTRRLNIYLIFIFILQLFSVHATFAKQPIRNVLYLNSYSLGYAWSDSITKGVIKALNQNNSKLYLECLDAKRFGQENFKVFSGYLAEKYANIRIDAVITSDNDALDFVIQYGNTLFPKIPVVFCGINNPEDYDFTGTDFYGFTESSDPVKSVSVLTQLVPQAKSLLFVTDNTTSGMIIKNEYQKLQRLYPFIKINFISDVDQDDLINSVKRGDQGDIVYLMRINRDQYGRLVDYLDFFHKIAEASPNPVFADDEAIMGYDVVGGNANRGYTQGFYSGQLALKLLNDSSRSGLLHFNNVQEEYIFDYKQLKKFDIPLEKLPAGSVVINKPVHYLKYIAYLIIIVAVLTAMVIVLIVLNTRRIRAERKVKEQLLVIEQSYSQLSDMNCELEEANAQLINLNASLEEAKKKAEESEKLKASFLANLSHEIRTPLNAILGFSSLLTEPDLNDHIKEKYYSIIQSNSDSLLVLIDDILDFSRIEAGQIQINTEPVMVNQVLEELYSEFRPSKNADIQFIISGKAISDQVILKTDKIRFKQILTNLLTNAFKFTEQGIIEMGFERENDKELKFFVKDSGIGIDKKYHKTIFERFRKLEEERTKLYSGSGLGLAICKKLTELLGGRIWVEGEPGKGSAFYFTHPDYSFIGNKGHGKEFNPKTNNDYNWKGNLIAVAEDENTNYLLIERILTSQGADLIRFKDGISIVNHFNSTKNNTVNVILMDLKMPGMDGIRAMELIKEKFPSVPIIALTAFAMKEDIEMISRRGFDDYVTKPVNMDILKEKLNKYLKNEC